MICYQIFVRSFADSNGDGIGDIKGITSKLDYLSELDIDSIWLTPIYPSPSYHKYDITDYCAIDPEYGTLDHLHELIEKAHAKNIKIILDLVLNHCSWQHPWFLAAISSNKNKYRDWFVWDIQKNITTYIDQWYSSPLIDDKEFYFAHFWRGMPDLNYDNTEVRTEVIRIAKFWIDQGVDGFRLDAAKHIFPNEREQENHRWWREFRSELEKIKPGIYLVGEVADKCKVIAPYLDYALNCCFNFELAENIIQSVNEYKHLHLAPWLVSVYENYAEDDVRFNDAIFISNHDQDRFASRFMNNIRKIKMAVSILFTLPGDLYIYYGEELGMLGEKPDEYIREPFLWDANDPLMTNWIEPKYSTRLTISSLSDQKKETSSVFNHYKKLLDFRKSMLNNISYKIDDAEYGSEILAYKIYDKGFSYLLLHNLSRHNMILSPEMNELSVIYLLNKNAMPFNRKIKIPAFESVMIQTPLKSG